MQNNALNLQSIPPKLCTKMCKKIATSNLNKYYIYDDWPQKWRWGQLWSPQMYKNWAFGGHEFPAFPSETTFLRQMHWKPQTWPLPLLAILIDVKSPANETSTPSQSTTQHTTTTLYVTHRLRYRWIGNPSRRAPYPLPSSKMSWATASCFFICPRGDSTQHFGVCVWPAHPSQSN